MEEILQAISTVGFPIAVAVYLLVRIEPRIVALTNCVKDLTNIVGTDSMNTKGVKDAIEKLTLEIARMNNK
ncbi:MAG: YvrJ family protein [Candidatus Atribacteria bacterium]|nr:YvrJ family protein [Candidatus Atribacteria bacterium]